ncbi:hypothetical protein ATZ36_14705 [Candidatus Endomicrobiellum trichonymphae]|uniref:Uncharacterized protein n=1 Tax=Endomicrobium trichonymphae TaxID=1408204 RepID=A0A1E5ILP4_ENDTX|nr:hypothetical protein ATZ36_14705 [Candidatus Endomicrobium trichonymphae]
MKEKDQLQLLIEETGCEQAEAEIALSLSDKNIEKAIYTIGLLLKFITVFKIKLIFPKENIYGLIHIAVNMKTYEILRFSMIFSHNPAIYEIAANVDWFSFEKAIFSARLDSGAMENYTQKIEENLKLYTQQSIKETSVISKEEISTIIKTFFHPIIIKMETVNEELNLTQFKKLPDYNTKQNEISFAGYNLGSVKLDVKILEDSNGKPAEKITESDTVLSLITDKRDIAHYLAHLTGGRKNGIMIPLPAMVKKIYSKNNDFEIHLHYAPSITGLTKIKSGIKLKVLETKSQLWWKK